MSVPASKAVRVAGRRTTGFAVAACVGSFLALSSSAVGFQTAAASIGKGFANKNQNTCLSASMSTSAVDVREQYQQLCGKLRKIAHLEGTMVGS